MKCNGVRHLLSAYLDGELDQGEELMVKQHIRRCHACADELNALRQTIALCASLEEVEVPADFRAGLRARLVALGPPVAVAPPVRAIPTWRKNAGRWALPAAAAAAFVVAVGVGPYMAGRIAPPVTPPIQETVANGAPQDSLSTPAPTATPATKTPVGGTQVAERPITNMQPTGQNPVVGNDTPPAEPEMVPPPVQHATKGQPVDPSRSTAGVASLRTPPDAQGAAEARYALSTSVHIGVQSGADALVAITGLAEQSSGTVVADGSTLDQQSGTISGVMASVPVANLEGFLASLQTIGTVSTGQVSQHDYGFEIEQKQVTIAQLRRDIENVDGVDTRAHAYQQTLIEEIARLEEELHLLVQKVETATVEVTLEQVASEVR